MSGRSGWSEIACYVTGEAYPAATGLDETDHAAGASSGVLTAGIAACIAAACLALMLVVIGCLCGSRGVDPGTPDAARPQRLRGCRDQALDAWRSAPTSRSRGDAGVRLGRLDLAASSRGEARGLRHLPTRPRNSLDEAPRPAEPTTRTWLPKNAAQHSQRRVGSRARPRMPKRPSVEVRPPAEGQSPRHGRQPDRATIGAIGTESGLS